MPLSFTEETDWMEGKCPNCGQIDGLVKDQFGTMKRLI